MRGKKNLKTILIFNFTVLAIIPIIILGIIGTLSVYNSLFAEIKQKNMLLVNSLNNEIEDFLSYNISVLKHISKINTEELQEQDKAAFSHLDSLMDSFGYFLSLQIIDRTGKLMAISPYDSDFIGNDFSGQDYFKALRSGSDLYISDTFIDPDSGEPGVTLAMKSGKEIVAGVLQLKKLSQITNKMKVGETGYTVVVDHKGYIIAHPRYSLVSRRTNVKSLGIISSALKGEKGTYQYTLDGTRRIGTTAPLPSTGWIVLITQARAEALRPVRRTAYIFALAVLIVAGLATLSGLANRRRITRPIYHLIGDAIRISEGKYPRHPREGGYEEIDELFAAFGKMAAAIQSREKELADSRENYRNLIEHANSLIIRWDKNKKITFFNEYAQKLFGYSPKEIIGKPLIGYTLPEKGLEDVDMERLLDHILRDPDAYRTHENEVITREGNLFWIQWSNKPIYDSEDNLTGILSIGTDRTEHKKAEEQINASLREKEILLKEIHHRVKNNMQIVSSLLNLQGSQMHDPRDMKLLQESQNRVHSMALVHEQMYQSENLAEINFRLYTEELVEYLAEMFLSEKDEVRYSSEIGDLFFSIETAIPCALIINELVTNALKYAFPGKTKKGTISISMTQDEKGGNHLVVRDSGVGFPDDFDPYGENGMGFQIVTALVDQLNGTLHINYRGGNEIEVDF